MIEMVFVYTIGNTYCVNKEIIRYIILGQMSRLISIIVPTKNEEKNIVHCLKGIEASTYNRNNIEVIVVDNGSVDQTVNVAKAYGAQTYILPNATISALRNYGSKKSRGDYLAFLDADCIPNPRWLKTALSTLMTLKDTAVVGGILVLNKDEKHCWIEEYWIDYLSSKYQQKVQYVNSMSGFCFVVKRNIFEYVNGFNENLITCEDADLGYRISQLGEKIVVNKDIEVVHLRNAKTSWEFFRRQLWQGHSNFASIFSRRFKVKEMPSIVFPLLYLSSLISLPLFWGIEMFSHLIILPLIFLIGLPILITLRSHVGRYKRRFIGYIYLWILYLSARGIGIFFKITHWKT